MLPGYSYSQHASNCNVDSVLVNAKIGEKWDGKEILFGLGMIIEIWLELADGSGQAFRKYSIISKPLSTLKPD